MNPTIRTVGRPIVPIDAERKRANRRLGRWMMVPWTVAIVGAVSTKFGLEHVGTWMFLGGWLVMVPMLVVAMRHDR